jgi:hypothetical protein
MPEPLLILCPPRSFSSIVCGIIGQHPDCYGLPEMNLFLGDDLGSVWNGHAVFMRSFGRDGPLRALAELHEGEQTPDSVTRAHEWILRHSDWPIKKVFDHLQELVGPERILVDKSPSTVFRREYLERALRVYPKANYMHLIRHPRGTADSVMSLRAGHEQLARMAGNFAQMDPERIWRTTHNMILALTDPLPLGQCMRLKGEDFLRDLDIFLPQVCEWLGIRSDAEAIAAMMHPEASPYARPGPRGAAHGNDPNFLESPAIDQARLARMREPVLTGELSWRPGDQFQPETRRVAKQLGYS